MKKIIFILSVLISLLAVPIYGSPASLHYMDGQLVGPGSVDWSRDIQSLVDQGDGTSLFTNYAHGYSFIVPQGYTVDSTMADTRITLKSSRAAIDIYFDNFSGTVHTAQSYVNYNKGFLKDANHKVGLNYWRTVNGRSVHLTSWSRAKLSKVKNDKNHYFVGEFLKNKYEVVTVMVRSQDAIGIHDRIVESFKFFDKTGVSGNHLRYAAQKDQIGENLLPYYNAVFSSDSPQRWGIFQYGATEDMSYLKSLEKKLNYQFDVLVRYQTLETPAPIEELKNAWANDRVVELTMQTTKRGDIGGVAYEILSGQHDEFLKQYARDLKRFGKPILFRLNNEMNGDWCTYSAYHYSRDPELYNELWRYIHSLFDAEGADNLLWVWNPHDVSFPNFKWNSAYNYFPGEAYVDIVGLTGYNTGTYHKGEIWRNFDEIYPKLYADYIRTFDFPLMITEFGSNNMGGDKAAWVRDMFSKMPEYDRIKLIIWFNGTDLDSHGKPARVYRMDTGDSVQQAFADNLGRFGGLSLPTIAPLDTGEMKLGKKGNTWLKQEKN